MEEAQDNGLTSSPSVVHAFENRVPYCLDQTLYGRAFQRRRDEMFGQ